MRIPTLNEIPTVKDNTEEFKGYNHNIRTGAGDWYDQKNMTTDYYPVASPRDKRSRQACYEPIELTVDGHTYKAEGIRGLAYTDGNLIALQTLKKDNANIGCCFVNDGIVGAIFEKPFTMQLRYHSADFYNSYITIDGYVPADLTQRLTVNNEYYLEFVSFYKHKAICRACEYRPSSPHPDMTYVQFVLSFVGEDEGESVRAYDILTAHSGWTINCRDIDAEQAQVAELEGLFDNNTDYRTLVRMGSYIFAAPDGVVYESANTVADVPIYKVAEEVETTNITFRTVIESTTEEEDYTPITIGSSYRYAEKQVQSYLTDGEMWVNQPTSLIIYKRNTTETFGHIKKGDAITLKKSGTVTVGSNAEYKDGIFDKVTSLANVKVLENGTLHSGTNIDDNITADTDYIVVSGFVMAVVSTTQYLALTASNLTITRKCPDMRFACESQNRIWTCSKDGHEIYASALGNPYNFYDYSGLSTDSYAVNVGTDGEFTGCVNYLNHPLFFKENALHYISGSYPTNLGEFDGMSYAVNVTTDFAGVEKGSERSLAIINNILYYKSASGIVAYDGSNTTLISGALGKERYKNAVAGSYNNKYYVSMEDSNGVSHMFVYDTTLGTWCREDNTNALQFIKVENELLYAVNTDVMSVADEDVLHLSRFQNENDIEWMCESGTFGYSYPNNKYLSRFQIRMNMQDNAKVSVFIEYNSDGVWHKKGEVSAKGTMSHLFPIVPIRCDHMKLKFEGKGDVKIISIAKMLEEGGDV